MAAALANGDSFELIYGSQPPKGELVSFFNASPAPAARSGIPKLMVIYFDQPDFAASRYNANHSSHSRVR